ncbi:prepilin peptidase [Bacillus marinisedimentorum]|uniref:prepilin peptidase n=1 Tax=Bacillus marinisedimentorum TaxID=1821260 RepID=UPI0008732752|nr:A24 family peptidase [Bacillus marinisedimentorum]
MNLLFYTYIFLIGLILGSFYNVVGLRIPAGRSIIKPRSACGECGTTLTAADLIPVVSYLRQHGKCRHCGTRVSPLYPATELLTAALFAAAPLFVGWTGELFVALPLISLVIIVFVSDFTYMIIPNKVLLFFGGLFILLRMFFPLEPWYAPFTGGAAGFALLYAVAVLSKGGMGGGDVKLFGVLGLVLGVKGVMLAFFFSTFYGALFGILGLLAGKLERKKPIPFGPFIGLGTLTAYFFGERLLTWYFNFY